MLAIYWIWLGMIGARQTTTSARGNTESNAINAPLDLKLISTIPIIGGATASSERLGEVTNKSSPAALSVWGLQANSGVGAERCMN